MIKPPHQAVQRNVWSPRSDRLQVLLSLSEGQGTALRNLGLNGGPGEFGQPRVRAAGGGELGTAAALLHWDHTDFGPVLKFDHRLADDRYVSLESPYSQAVEWRRGTLLLRVRIDPRRMRRPLPLVHAGPSNAAGDFRVQAIEVEPGQAAVEATLWDASGQPATVTSGPLTGRRWYNLIVSWGERGLLVRVGDTPPVVLAFAGGWRLPAFGELQVLAEIHGQTRRFARTGLSTFALWDVPLSDREARELLIDPHLPMRPPTGAGFLFKNNPLMTRPTRDDQQADACTLTFNCVSSGDTGAEPRYRIRYRAVGQAAWRFSSVAGVSNSELAGEVFQSMPLGLTRLADGVEYEWLAEWAEGESGFQPFPGGLGRFRTPPRADEAFSFAFVTDDHLGNRRASGLAEVETGLQAADAAAFANWRTDRDIYERAEADFLIDGGDNIFIALDNGPSSGELDDGRLADLDPAKFERIAAWVAGHNLRIKSAPLFLMLGNHEGESGFQQNSARNVPVALQKQATIARKRAILNPGPETYRAQLGIDMGENEPPPDELGNDWIPGLADTDVRGIPFDEWRPGRSYRDDFVRDQLGPGGAWAENRSPLLNYYAWRWGSVLCVVLDVFRYSNPGERAETAVAEGTIGAHFGIGGLPRRLDRPWRLGAEQKRFIRRVLAAGQDIPWKLIFLHQLPGGELLQAGNEAGDERYYGRGSGIRLPVDDDGQGADQLWLADMCRRHGVAAVVKGHDHRFAVVEGATTWISGPTAGAWSHLGPEQAGWNSADFADSYGSAESLGRYDSAGRWLGDRVRAAFNVIGYVRFDVTPKSLTLTLRQTTMSLDSEGRLPTLYERWLGPLYRVNGGRIDLKRPLKEQAGHGPHGLPPCPGQRPEAIGLIAAASALQPGWWTPENRPANLARNPGDLDAAESYSDGAQIAVQAPDGTIVAAAATPRDVVRYTLARPDVSAGHEQPADLAPLDPNAEP